MKHTKTFSFLFHDREMVVKRRTLKGAAAVEEEGVNTQDPQLPPTDLDSATTKPLNPQRGKGSTNSSPRQVLCNELMWIFPVLI